MDKTIDLTQLRQLFLTAPESEATRIVAFVASMALLIVVLWLLRRGKLREEYTPIWLGLSVVLLVISIRLDFLRWITDAIGAWTTSSTIFFLGELFLLAICLSYAVRLSSAFLHIKNLSQEMAILRTQVDALRRELSASTTDSDSSAGGNHHDAPGAAPV